MRPEAPIITEVVAMHNFITIKWKPKFNGGHPQSFFLEYQKKQDVKSNVFPVGTVNMTVIYDLDFDTEYTIRMFAKNKINRSLLSDDFVIKTGNI